MTEPVARYAFLRRPAWFALGSMTLLLTLLFINLGLWQLERLDAVRIENAIVVARSQEAIPTEQLGLNNLSLSEASDQHDKRRSFVTGEFVTTDEFLVRSQTHNGVAGFHVITPLEQSEGNTILVNRGWVPLEMDTPPVPVAPPSGIVTLEVLLAGTQERGQFGPQDEDGSVIVSRIDIARMEAELGYALAPLYAIATTALGDVPRVVQFDPPSEGPHRNYAIQWFAFALISVVGFLSLARSTEMKARRRRDRSVVA